MGNIEKGFAEEIEWLKAAKQKMAARLPEVTKQVSMHNDLCKLASTLNDKDHK